MGGYEHQVDLLMQWTGIYPVEPGLSHMLRQ